MRKLSVFESITLDGFFTDKHGDMSWAHAGADDPEFAAFTAGNADPDSGGVLVFGRVTYDMMSAFWPTTAAAQMMPDVAAGMNKREKIVFSRTLDRADWSNTRIIRDDPATALAALKKQPGGDLVILGSGQIVAQAAKARLVDAYQFVLTPVIIGEGRTLFEGVDKPAPMKLMQQRAFKNGKIVASYEPA